MKTPDYWQKNNLQAKILTPVGLLYGLLTKLRLKTHKPKKVAVPVICIGNITAGGTGKTPVSLSVARMLSTEMLHPFFLTRGYGGKLQNVIVNNRKHSAYEVGDEALLLAQQSPVVINANRFQGAATAINEGADVIVMDDGFQNPGLHKDLSFLVFDGNYGIGNGKIIPAGPLRETLANGLKRADALIILGKDKQNLASQTDLPVFFGHLESSQAPLTQTDVLAFAGIGHPEKFYHTLREQGFNVVDTMDFPDHHFYTAQDLQKIIERAQKLNAEIYTTSKDFVKIPNLYQKDINVLEISVVWDKPEKLRDFILQKIQKNPDL